MQVASLELCKELYELSKWGEYGQENVSFWYQFGKTLVPRVKIGHDTVYLNSFPAYDLGYLLRKLYKVRPKLLVGTVGWAVTCDSNLVAIQADTPEDAVALLAIELLKQNVLTRG